MTGRLNISETALRVKKELRRQLIHWGLGGQSSLRRAAIRDWLTAPYISTAAPIFVGGSGRSGTTLMSVMSNAHPDVYCGKESNLLLRSTFTIDLIADNLLLDKVELIQLAAQSKNWGQFIERALLVAQNTLGVSRVASKNPGYVFFLSVLLQTFPSGRFIYMYRDGRDVAVSIRNKASHLLIRPDAELDADGLPSIAYCATIWKMFVNGYRGWCNDSRCFAVGYEKLLSEPHEQLKRVCEHVEIPFDERMTDFHIHGIAHRDDLAQPHLDNVNVPLITRNDGKWRKALTLKQVQTFEAIAGPELTWLGYKLSQ